MARIQRNHRTLRSHFLEGHFEIIHFVAHRNAKLWHSLLQIGGKKHLQTQGTEK